MNHDASTTAAAAAAAMTGGIVVWTPQTPKPRYWTATGTDNPVILLAWSYKSWIKKIIHAYTTAA